MVLVPTGKVDLLEQLVRIAHLADHRGLVVASNHGPVASHGKDSTKAFAVDDTHVPATVFDVALVAAGDPLAPFFRVFEAADLNARVMVGELELGLQFEVGRFVAPPDEERIARGGVFRRGLADDTAILDPPEFRVAVPAFQRLTVEDRSETVLFGPQGRRNNGKGHG